MNAAKRSAIRIDALRRFDHAAFQVPALYKLDPKATCLHARVPEPNHESEAPFTIRFLARAV